MSRWIPVPLVPSRLPEPVLKNARRAINVHSASARRGRTVASDVGREAKPGGGSYKSPPSPKENRRETRPVPGLPVAPGPLPRPLLWRTQQSLGSLARGQTRSVLECPRFHPLLPPQQACSVMCPVGISFIIFPLHLINPHPIMNLEISIKHIITNQHRAGGSWRLLTAGRAVRLGGRAPAPPAGLSRGPGAPSLLRHVGRDLGGSSGGGATLGMMLSGQSCRGRAQRTVQRGAGGRAKPPGGPPG